MQIQQPIQNLYEVESSIFLGHTFDLLQIEEEFASWTIYDKVKFLQSRTKQTKLVVSKAWFKRTMNGWFSCEEMFF